MFKLWLVKKFCQTRVQSSVVIFFRPKSFFRYANKSQNSISTPAHDQNKCFWSLFFTGLNYQRLSRGRYLRGQGHKKIQGQGPTSLGPTFSSQGQECSGPKAKDTKRNCSQKKNSHQKFFWATSKKMVFAHEDAEFSRKIRGSSKKKSSSQIFREVFAVFQGKLKRRSCYGPFLTNQKKCCLQADCRSFSRTDRLRGQGLDLRDKGQRLQNESSRTPPLSITHQPVVLSDQLIAPVEWPRTR